MTRLGGLLALSLLATGCDGVWSRGGFPDPITQEGHNMLGLSMAPATGKLVGELLTGQQPHLDPTPYRVGRFRRGSLRSGPGP